MRLFSKKKRHVHSAKGRGVTLPPSKIRKRLASREYKIYKKSWRHKRTWYEMLARTAGSFLKISADKKTSEKVKNAVSFTGMQVKPSDVMALTILTILTGVTVSLVTFITGILEPQYGMLFIALSFLLAFYFYKYPENELKRMRMEASSQIVLAVLYMVVSMRISANLESALKFTAANISGALAWDMRKLLWDIEMGKYYSANEAIDAYIVKWKPENEEFSEALRLIRDSQKQAPGRAKQELDQALETILSGTKTRMKHYSQDLRLPVMVIHMMGIVLPILGTIMAPLAAVFLSDLVGPHHFILGYNIILPLILIWFINSTLKKRPVTFSSVDIAGHPNVPKKGSFRAGGTSIPVLPISLAILLVFLVPAVMFFIQNPENLSLGIGEEKEFSIFSLVMSMMFILGIGISLSVHFILTNFQRIRIMKKVEKIEGQLELALLQLGNKIAGGTPVEVALQNAIGDMKDIEISGLFTRSLHNMKSLGMTFEDSFFDRKYGALRYYPSRLIKNIMYTVIDTSKKGLTYASEAMIRIGKYLKNIRETQEYIRDMLSETASSMKFQAYFLTPLISGLIVSMAHVIVKVLAKLGKYLESMTLGGTLGGFEGVAGIFGSMKTSVSPEMFQLILGFYLIEVLIILGIFLNKIERGEDKVSQWHSTGKIMILGIIIYFIIALISTSLFSGIIEEALVNLNIIS